MGRLSSLVCWMSCVWEFRHVPPKKINTLSIITMEFKKTKMQLGNQTYDNPQHPFVPSMFFGGHALARGRRFHNRMRMEHRDNFHKFQGHLNWKLARCSMVEKSIKMGSNTSCHLCQGLSLEYMHKIWPLYMAYSIIYIPMGDV